MSKAVAHRESSRSIVDDLSTEETDELFSQNFNNYQREVGAAEAEWISRTLVERVEMRQIKQVVYGADASAEGVEGSVERGKARKRR
jgi:hypothetical protein